VEAHTKRDSKGGGEFNATHDCESSARTSCSGNVSEETRKEEANLLQELNICDVLYWVLGESDDKIREI